MQPDVEVGTSGCMLRRQLPETKEANLPQSATVRDVTRGLSIRLDALYDPTSLNPEQLVHCINRAKDKRMLQLNGPPRYQAEATRGEDYSRLLSPAENHIGTGLVSPEILAVFGRRHARLW